MSEFNPLPLTTAGSDEKKQKYRAAARAIGHWKGGRPLLCAELEALTFTRFGGFEHSGWLGEVSRRALRQTTRYEQQPQPE